MRYIVPFLLVQIRKNVSLFGIAFGSVYPVFAQIDSTRIVTGIITIEGSQTKLADVVVSIKGTSFGTYSDTNGQYRVKLSPSEKQLVFIAIGYLPQEIHIDAQQIANVSLKPDSRTLPELKVTGYVVPEYSRRLKKSLRKLQR